MAENWLTSTDWQTLACAALSGGDYLLWKPKYVENCRETLRCNAQASNDWTADMLLGEGNYITSDTLMQYDSGLFAQINTAAMRA